MQASLLFRWYNSEGMPVAEAGVNAATVPATRFVTFAEQGEGKNGTGVAYANPSDTAALVTFTARDADGEVRASEDLIVAAQLAWCAKYADPVRSQQLYRIARSHLHGAHRQSVAELRSRPRIFLLASGGTGCFRARIYYVLPRIAILALARPEYTPAPLRTARGNSSPR